MTHRTTSRTTPQVYVIAGCNGSGKTTFARTFLPQYARCLEFVNADLIAAGLSPFAPGSSALAAGKLVISRIHELIKHRASFGFETTLSGLTYRSLFQRLTEEHYFIDIAYLWIPDVKLALQRVADRVRNGGHSVPEADVRRRYERSLHNFFHTYRRFADTWTVFNGSGVGPQMIATFRDGIETVVDRAKYQQMKEMVS